MPHSPMRDLADRLHAAVEDRDAYHHDLCREDPGGECSCGMPILLSDLAEVWRQLGLTPRLAAGDV